MDALKRKTLDDLLAEPDERVELVDGEILKRPMVHSDHGLAQSKAVVELSPFTRPSGPGGWWIITEVSVSYELHQCLSQRRRTTRIRPTQPMGIAWLGPTD